MPIRDTRMMARAIVQRWPIKNEDREAIIRRLVRIVADQNSSPREVTAAAKGILAAEKQNQDDEHKIVDVRIARRHDELAAIAAELGVEFGVIEDANRKTDSGPGPASGLGK